MVEPLIGRESGLTRVLVSHDVEGALAESDRALVLASGGVVGLRGTGLRRLAGRRARRVRGEA